ncbi:hypothetical protein COOONC_01578, partial [Cooperia oncophora]
MFFQNLRPDNFPRLNRVNHPGGAPTNAKAAQPPPTTSSNGVPSSSSAHPKARQTIQAPNHSQRVEDFPALPAASKQGPTKSAWVNKKSSKSVIVGCKMPNGSRVLPQPDVWPDISVSTPAREVEPEQWQEVPAKPPKVDKKIRRAQQKAVKLDNTGTLDETQENHTVPSGSTAGTKVANDFNMVKVTGN